jgi:hypothetical protein
MFSSPAANFSKRNLSTGYPVIATYHLKTILWSREYTADKLFLIKN